VCPLFVWRSKSPRTKTSSTRRPPPQKPTQRLHNDGTVLHAKAFVCPLSVWRSKSPHTKASSTQRPLFKTGPYAKRALDQNHACKDHVYNITRAIPTKASFQNGPLRKKGPWPRLQVQRSCDQDHLERWGAGVETQKNVRGEIGGWGRVPFNETYAPSSSTIYDGA